MSLGNRIPHISRKMRTMNTNSFILSRIKVTPRRMVIARGVTKNKCFAASFDVGKHLQIILGKIPSLTGSANSTGMSQWDQHPACISIIPPKKTVS